MKPHNILWPVVIISVVTLLGLPLLGSRFIPTHDGEYHIIRFWQFTKMLSNGYAFPRWAPTLNSGFGIPIFQFHYPFPNYVGSLFHLMGFQFVDAFKLTLFVGYLLSGIFCYLFLSKLWNARMALIGTIAMLTVPYWFVDIYVRGSVGEVWAITWLFAALASLIWQKSVLVAVSAALLILSHNIQAVLFFPVIVLAAWMYSPKSLLAIFLGLALSAYFWIPALAERSFVAGLSTVNPLDHFASLSELLVPSWGTEFSNPQISANKMSFQIGVLPLMWITVAGWGLPVIAVLAFFMLPASQFFWMTVPGISYIQYPWRLLSLVIPIVAVSAAYAAKKLPTKAAAGMAILSVVLVYGYSRPATYERRDDMYYLSRKNFTDGTSSLGNAFSTIWAPWKADRAENFVEITDGEAAAAVQQQKLLETKIVVQATSQANIRINKLYFPGWTVYDNGDPMAIDYQSEGVIDVSLPAGTHLLDVRFEETPVRKAADLVSIAGLSGLLGWTILDGIYAYRHKHRTTVRRAQPAGHRHLHKRTDKRPHRV